MKKKLPDQLSRECIIAAMRAYDEGVRHQFSESRLYDVVFEGCSYPPKAIVGIAASNMTGVEFSPEDFSGGIKSKCVKLLTAQGFQIVEKIWVTSGPVSAFFLMNYRRIAYLLKVPLCR